MANTWHPKLVSAIKYFALNIFSLFLMYYVAAFRFLKITFPLLNLHTCVHLYVQ